MGLTVLETHYMEQMPRILRELTSAVEELTKEVAELKEQLKNKNE